MATNLIEQVNQMMGHPLTKKEEPSRGQKTKMEKTLHGAAVPAALAGIYHLASFENGASRILDHLKNHRHDIENHHTAICAEFTFGDTLKSVVDRIADYAGESPENSFAVLNEAAREAYRQLLTMFDPSAIKPEEITKYMVAQRHTILAHLPEELQLGHLLGDETMDDVSNKMEGPVSTLIHKLGETFSSSPR